MRRWTFTVRPAHNRTLRLAVTGGRDHTPTPAELATFDALWTTLQADSDGVLVHGAATGVDTALDEHVSERWPNARIESFPADWRKHGRAAGPIRNASMLAHADALVAFPRHDARLYASPARVRAGLTSRSCVVDAARRRCLS